MLQAATGIEACSLQLVAFMKTTFPQYSTFVVSQTSAFVSLIYNNHGKKVPKIAMEFAMEKKQSPQSETVLEVDPVIREEMLQ
jgi:hypothetical protein